MAELTWRNVDTPQLNTRDIAIGGAALVSSFDRLGAMLQDRQTATNREATDAAIAEKLALQDPEAVKAALAAGVQGLGRNVDPLEYMKALGAHSGQLTERAMNQEQLLTLQDPAKNGALYADLTLATKVAEVSNKPEDWAKVDALKTQLVGARNIGGAMSAGYELGNTDQDQIQRKRQADQAHQVDLGNLAARQSEVRSGNEVRAATLEGIKKTNAKTAEAEAMVPRAQRAMDVYIKKGIIDPTVINEAFKATPYYNSLKPHEKEAFMAEAGDYLKNRTSLRTLDAEGSGLNKLVNTTANLKADAGVTKSAIETDYLSKNPDLDVYQRVTAMGDKQADNETVYKLYAANSGIHNPAKTIDAIKTKYNLSNNEMIALQQSSGFKDGSWLDTLESQTDYGGENSRQRRLESNPLIGGTFQLERRAAEYNKARTEKDSERGLRASQLELSRKTAGFGKQQQDMDRLVRQAAQEVAAARANGQPKPMAKNTTLQKIADLQVEMRNSAKR